MTNCRRALFALVALVFAGLPVGASASAPSRPTRDVIVQAASSATARQAVEAAGGRVTEDLWLVDGVAADVPADALPALEQADGVTSVTANAPVEVQSDPEPVRTATAVYPHVIGADQLWSEGVNGAGVTVALIDTGVADVADLAGRVVGGIDLSGENNPYLDSYGHGTFVAGLIAGNGASSQGLYQGVAPQANLVSIKIAGRDGASDVIRILAAIQWAVAHRSQYDIRILNLSLGTDSTQSYLLSPLNFAVEQAWDNGIVVTVSSSNEGPGAGTVSKPGDDPLVVTVGAVDDAGTTSRADDVMAGFSGEGPTVADGLEKPDLVAPGRSVVSLRAPGSAIDEQNPGSRVDSAYFKGSGTSFSTAVASGTTALLLQREPGLTPDQLKARLLGTAATGPVGNVNIDGHGSLDAYAAAHAGTFDSANQGVPRSTGSGSGTLDETGLDGSRWYGSRWYGSRWYGSRWYGSRWYGSRWYAIAWE